MNQQLLRMDVSLGKETNTAVGIGVIFHFTFFDFLSSCFIKQIYVFRKHMQLSFSILNGCGKRK